MVDFFDFVKELRKGEPDIRKAEKAMKILGWICSAGALWNFIIYFIAPFKESPFNLPPQYPYLALVSLLLLGALFFRSAGGIREMEPWGRKTGQIAIVLLMGILIGFMFYLLPTKAIPRHDNTFSIVLILLGALFGAQFAVPAYFGIRYLGRLPVKEDGNTPGRYTPQESSMKIAATTSKERTTPQISHKEALFPFGLMGTFAIILGVSLLIIFIGQKYAGPMIMPYLILSLFLVAFFAPVLYNYFPSSFQEKRDVIASFTGGGSIFLFHGSWPFFRLMVYMDGLEVRFMFHCFFIPYDKMADIPDKIGFFNRGILIKSDLADVPSGIRFGGFGMKKIAKLVRETKAKYLARPNNN